MSGGPFAESTRLDNVPLDSFGGTAHAGADATDNSANVNVTGANDVAANASAEAQEIAAVPDPESPAGQAAILAIIEKYQSKNAGTVEGSAATEQSNGSQAADGASSDHGSSEAGGQGQGGGGGGSLMDILSSLLGAGGSGMSGMSGMNPMGQGGMNPFGQQGMGGFGQQGATPFGQQGAPSQAADPFADPFGSATPAAAPANYNPAADPFASAPSTGTVTTAANTETGTPADPFAPADHKSDGDKPDGDGTHGQPTKDTGPAGASGSPSSGVDAGAFSNADGSAVPADPATSGATQ